MTTAASSNRPAPDPAIRPTWCDRYGAAEHASAVLWLVNEIDDDGLVAPFSELTASGDVPDELLELLSAGNRTRRLEELNELSRGANHEEVAELIIRWVASSRWSPQAKADTLGRMVGTVTDFDSRLYMWLVELDDLYHPEWGAGHGEADAFVKAHLAAVVAALNGGPVPSSLPMDFLASQTASSSGTATHSSRMGWTMLLAAIVLVLLALQLGR